MKQLFFLAMMSVLFGTACQREKVEASAEPAINFPAVLEQAKSENKSVLLKFTGSDWCPPCMQMQANVLSKPEFKKYADENLIFVVVDFPNDIPQSPEQKKVNEELADKFKADAFPTFVLLNSAGEEIWREVGAFVQTPSEFIAAIDTAKVGEKKPTSN